MSNLLDGFIVTRDDINKAIADMGGAVDVSSARTASSYVFEKQMEFLSKQANDADSSLNSGETRYRTCLD